MSYYKGKKDKKQSWELESSQPRPGRRSMTDAGGWHRGRVVVPGKISHTMSPEAHRTNFYPKTVSVNINDRWYSATVIIKAA
jgi:hypothetical protein